MSTRSRILAVDDNPLNLAVIEETLQTRFKVRVVDSGSAALRLAPTFLPDVVLLDVMMPAPDGLEVCRRLRSDPELRHCRIIMVSAKTDIDDRLRGYEAGADDYVTKPFDEHELLAKVTAAAHHEILGRTVQRDKRAVCSAVGELLELVSRLRDVETEVHLDRIRAYSQLLAGELRTTTMGDQIDDVFLDDLHNASVLHDIGKIAIPDAILRKEGPLTDLEARHLREHTLAGERILKMMVHPKSEATFFNMAAQIARSHHERFDGQGYPDHLAGDQIPLAARIIKVADVFDSISSRPVRQHQCPCVRAKEAILRGRGTSFDPAVVDAMLGVFEEMAFMRLYGDDQLTTAYSRP